jgi:hypothetical protein
VTAGAGNDSLVDSPTRYGTDTGAGGQVRGNYATLNPLDINASAVPTFSEGNLRCNFTSSSYTGGVAASMSTDGIGKWYFEVTPSTVNTMIVGVLSSTVHLSQQNNIGNTGRGYRSDGQKNIGGVFSAYGASYVANDVIGIAIDHVNNEVTFYKNGVSQGVAGTAGTTNWKPAISANSASANNAYINFGQRPFAYTAPSGFKALVTTNLPTPTIEDGGEYFNAVTYTGTGASRSVTTGFQPDLVWIKDRGNVVSHILTDSVRGTNLWLRSNSTAADVSDTTAVTAFNSTGFSLGTGASSGAVNNSGNSYISWNWKAGGTPAVSNTAGTITSTVSVNTTSGFSIVTYTGTGANATVGHGLGVAPKMVILKSRSSSIDWAVYHASLTTPATQVLFLNLTNAAFTSAAVWNSTNPTSSVFSLGNSTTVNSSGASMLAYCFAEVPGYSAFGSYTGNGSADGPFVFTGFRPRYIMQKRTDSTGTWELYDTARDTYNVMSADLAANLSDAETTVARFDSLSNGFKIRTTGAATNASGGTYIYMAFAENPFSIALAR